VWEGRREGGRKERKDGGVEETAGNSEEVCGREGGKEGGRKERKK
jgi:hypothetical protein